MVLKVEIFFVLFFCSGYCEDSKIRIPLIIEWEWRWVLWRLIIRLTKRVINSDYENLNEINYQGKGQSRGTMRVCEIENVMDLSRTLWNGVNFYRHIAFVDGNSLPETWFARYCNIYTSLSEGIYFS